MQRTWKQNCCRTREGTAARRCSAILCLEASFEMWHLPIRFLATSGSYYSFMVHRGPPYFIDRPGTLRAGRKSINQSMEQGWMNQMAQLFNLWEIPAAVLSSFAAHLFLVLFAGIRRRKASGVLMLVLWLAYQLANWVAPYALSNLSLCDPSPRQQLIAFWAPFLLHHLGGPDNISAFSLEDNALSGREALTVVSRIGGASYVLYKHVYIGSGGGGGSLILASIIVFVVGAAKYVERAFALWQGDLGNIRSSRKKEKQPITSCSDSLITMGCHHLLLDEEALLVAHQMLPFCKRAMSDSSVDADDHDLDRSRKIFTLRWENMCSVVEMELSLMYDILYTKAAVVHTWHGNLIRTVTPLAIATAIVLFGFHNIEDQAILDVIITYTLLLGTFLLDTRWLFRALGSTWMHAFLQASRLHRALFGIGRWHRLRRVFVSLDLGRLRLTAPPRSPSSYRRWSGKVGHYSLLRESAREISRCGRAAKKIGLEDVWKEYQHSNTRKLSEEVKQAVFTRVTEVLRSTYEEANKDGRYSMRDITTSWGQLTAKRYKEKHAKGDEEEELHLAFGREFQEDILVWHIATTVFLMSDGGKLCAETKHAKAIKALSEYLMFLVAVRRHMLPGLMLRSLYERTFESLQRVWRNERDKASSSSSTSTKEEQKLAQILLGDKQGDSNWGLDDVETSIVSDGANLAIELLRGDGSEMSQLLELVFNVWVDKLLHAAVSCSTESHAKQLSRGGDFTTIVWIMAQHAGPFQIGEQGPDYDEKPEDEIEKKSDKTEKEKPEEKKAEGKKKKEAEEKKKKDEEKKAGESGYPPYWPYPQPSWPPAVDQWMPPAQPVPQPSWPPAVDQWMPPAQPVPQPSWPPAVDQWIPPDESVPQPGPGGPPKEDVKRPKRRRARSRRYATLYPVD